MFIIKWKLKYNPPFPVLRLVIYWGVWQPHPEWNGGKAGTTDFSVIRTVGREGVCVALELWNEFQGGLIIMIFLYIHHMQISNHF